MDQSEAQYVPCFQCGMTAAYFEESDCLFCEHCNMPNNWKFGVKDRIKRWKLNSGGQTKLKDKAPNPS